jgi:choline dehydrogenase-like flavoprotein
MDKHSARGAMMALDRELRRLDLGYAVPEGWLEDEAVEWECDKLVSAHPIGGYHHMGTARMGISDKESVTDGDGRVHGVENLYIAGSALFPTGGWANPTLTIIALALRLADKIKDNKTGAYRG